MSDIDLVSPFKITNGYSADPEVIARLLNIPGYTYTFGYAYPGEKENHEFIFYRAKGIIVKDCQINVDETGQFWINNLSQASKVYLNKKLVKQIPRVLKIGDSVSFGTPQTYDDHQEGPVFRVEKRCIHKSRKKTSNLLQSSDSIDADIAAYTPPLKVSLIVSKTLSYLNFKDLKECRLVCQVWNEEGSKFLSKMGKVTFNFHETYLRPIQSTQIFRYLNEVKTLNMKSLQLLLPSITLPDEEEDDEAFSDILHGIDQLDTGTDESNGIFYRSSLSAYFGEPGHKLIDDLKDLLASNHNFTCLQLSFRIVHPMSRTLCNFIFSQLGQRLEGLELDEKFLLPSYSMNHPFYVISFPNLKRYKHFAADFTNKSYIIQEQRLAPLTAWIDFIVPLLPKTLESFSSSGNIAELYFLQLLRRRDLQLRQISITEARPEGLMKLLRVPLPLTALELPQMQTISSQRSVSFLERVLQKSRETLKKLVLDLNATVVVIVKFPSFKNLKEFSLTYDPNVRIRTDDLSEVVDYSETFPVLRSLEVRPIRRFVESESKHIRNLPFQWESAEDSFSFFFPSESDQRCLTVTSLGIPFLWDEDWMQMEAALYGQNPPAQFAITLRRLTYQFRLQRIIRMFPKVKHKDVKEPETDFQICQGTRFRRA